MAKRAFGAYAVRAVGHKDKAKWKVEIAATAAEARKIAKRLAWSKLGTYAPEVCIFDLSRWSRRPVCLRRTDLAGKHVRNKLYLSKPTQR